MAIDLVTGGAGFIGSHLVRRLVREGRPVRVIDDLSTGQLERLRDVAGAIEMVRADLATAALDNVVRDVDRIFHLAAIPSVPRSVADPVATNASIVTATLRLLEAARRWSVRRFVHSSSSSVYGDTPVSPKHEGLSPDPLSPYAVAKLAAEGYVRVFASLHGLSAVSLRYFNVFGPGQDPASQYAAVIPRFIRLALHGEPLTVYGDGEQTRDFTYVDNVVDANLLAASRPVASGSVYNVAAGQPRSIVELVETLSDIFGRRLDVRHAPPRLGEIRHSHAGIGSAKRDLGWEPRIPLAEGLRRTVDSFR